MTFLPFEKIVYKTKLSEAEVMNRLVSLIGQERWLRFFYVGNKPYLGKIVGRCFKIRRISFSLYRNTSRPVIIGLVQSGADEVTIRVTMRLSIPAYIASFFILAGILFICYQGMFIYLVPFDSTLSSFGLSFLVLLFITLGGFKFESRRSRADLQKIFEAEII